MPEKQHRERLENSLEVDCDAWTLSRRPPCSASPGKRVVWYEQEAAFESVDSTKQYSCAFTC